MFENVPVKELILFQANKFPKFSFNILERNIPFEQKFIKNSENEVFESTCFLLLIVLFIKVDLDMKAWNLERIWRGLNSRQCGSVTSGRTMWLLRVWPEIEHCCLELLS